MKTLSKQVVNIFYWIFLCHLPLYGQQTTLDSLEKVVQQSDNVQEQIDLLITLSQRTRGRSLQKASSYVEQAIVLAKQHKFPIALGQSYTAKAPIKAIAGDLDSAELLLLQALDIFDTHHQDKELVNVYNGLGIVNIY